MGKTFLHVFLMNTALVANAQNYSKTISVCSGNYTLVGTAQPDHSIHVTITDITTPANKADYSYSGSSVSDFASVFQSKFLAIGGIVCTTSDKNIILAEGNKLWYQLFVPAPAPKAGLLSVPSKIKIHARYYNPQKKKEEDAHAATAFDIQEVHMEINSGYIETIYVIVKVNNVPITFINLYGIGFSTFANFGDLDKINLVELHTIPFAKLSQDPAVPAYSFVKMSDLLSYNPDLEVDRRDYSPKDTAFTLNGGQSIQLYKQETNKLFEAHIFTDFIGLQDDKPNGLVQTEVAKRINLNSVQWLTNRALYGAFKSWGIFQYIAPTVTLSKLEQHNKRLVLGDLDSIRISPGTNDTANLSRTMHRYQTPLEIFRRQSFSAGFDLNLLYFSNHSFKYNLYFNLGARLGITPVSDSLTSISTSNAIAKTGIVNEYTINTLELIPEARVIFLPEERFNFSVAYQGIFMHPFNGNFQLLTFDKTDPTRYHLQKSYWLNTYELLVAYNVNPDSKLYARLRFNSEINNYNNNFAQIQIGYSTYILGH